MRPRSDCQVERQPGSAICRKRLVGRCVFRVAMPDLASDSPFKPTWDSLLKHEAHEWYLFGLGA